MDWEAQALEASQAQVREQLQQQIRLGQEARSLLSNPVVEAFFSEGLEAMLLAGEALADNAKTTEEELAKHLKAIAYFRRFKRFVEYAFEDGKASEERLKDLTKSGEKSYLGGIF